MSEAATQIKNRRLDRRSVTKGCVKATCRKGTLDLGPNLAVGVLDVSETGVRLVLREAIDVKQEVAVTLEGLNHPRPIRRVGRIVWCLETDGATFCVGVRLDSRLPYSDCRKLT